ncbi:MAG: hypothetical protein Q8N39_04375 [Pelolinea sp.]|nr:hypothetical protein [Pelolinea sp.]
MRYDHHQRQRTRELGLRLVREISSRQPAVAYMLLTPIMAERTPFRLLDLIGESLAESPFYKLDPFLNEIATHATIGGWIVIAPALIPGKNAGHHPRYHPQRA